MANRKFELNDDEEKKADAFTAAHREKHRGQRIGAIGGLFSFDFTQTSLGRLAGVKCNSCKELETLTDLSEL